jgi:hypothetical protein
MRKNINTKSRAIRISDAAVICVCLLGTAAFLVLFQKDLNRSLRRIGEEPVGFVASKSRAALRRFQDRGIWDRLQKDSPVYNGDFIRTSEGSEAAIGFPGGALVGISGNSLVRVFVEAEDIRIDFAGGNISVYAGESEDLNISFGGNQVKAAAGSMITLDAGTGEEGVFSLQVIEGNASLTGPGGEREAAAGTALILGAAGTESGEGGFREAPAAVFEPPPAARFLAPVDAPLPVQFAWTGEGPARIEIARSPNFSSSLTVWEGDSPGTPAIPPGRWYWRVSRPENAGTERMRGQLTVVRAPPPEPVSPASEAVYYYLTEKPELRFQWEGSEDVLYYVLEAADNPGMTDPALRTEVRHNSLVYSHLDEGRWYWRVTPVFSALYRGTVSPSPVVPFAIVLGERTVQNAEAANPPPETAALEEPLAAAVPAEAPPSLPPQEAAKPPSSPPTAAAVALPPSPSRPENTARREPPPLPAASGRKPESGYVIDAAFLRESRTIVFSWNPVEGADAYVFSLFQETGAGQRRSVIKSEASETSYTLEDLSLLERGRFVWQVEAVNRGTDGSGGRRGSPGENLFTVDIPQPNIPRGRDPGALYGR